MSVRDGQMRLRKIGRILKAGAALNEADRTFLAVAMVRIADGEDANNALGVKAKRGERKSKHAQKRKDMELMALGWIAAAMEPHENGSSGLTLEEACLQIGEPPIFGLKTSSLLSLWNKFPDRRKVEFEISEG